MLVKYANFVKIQPIAPDRRVRPKPSNLLVILPIRVCAAQWGSDFEAPDLERGIHFRGVF